MNLYLESLEGGFFVAATGNENEKTVIKDDSGKPRTYNSMEQVRAHFSGKDFDKVWLRQCTPYDEMVGQPADQEKSLDVEVEW